MGIENNVKDREEKAEKRYRLHAERHNGLNDATMNSKDRKSI